MAVGSALGVQYPLGFSTTPKFLLSAGWCFSGLYVRCRFFVYRALIQFRSWFSTAKVSVPKLSLCSLLRARPPTPHLCKLHRCIASRTFCRAVRFVPERSATDGAVLDADKYSRVNLAHGGYSQ